jgi:Fe-S oxidoreductase
VPAFRSRFLQLYHTRYLRPARDHLVATVESYAPLMARAPKTFNFFMSQPWVRNLSQKHIGMVDLPMLSTPTLQQQLVGHRSANTTLEQLEKYSAEQRAKTVLVVQDPFTSYYDAQVVADFVRLVEKLGFEPVVLPFSPNGKAQHIKGFLQKFARTARKTSEFLNRIAKLGMPMVGVDPALVLCYRDEYKQTLGEERGDFHVQLVHEWLPGVLADRETANVGGEAWYLFGHCTEVTALPAAPNQWASIFARFGAKLENVSVGCCGMAGTYGHEVKNHASSLGIYELSWHQAMQRLPRQRCLATGYSCRSQVKRVEGNGVRHPLQALLEIVG